MHLKKKKRRLCEEVGACNISWSGAGDWSEADTAGLSIPRAVWYRQCRYGYPGRQYMQITAEHPTSCMQPALPIPSHLINVVLAVTTHRGHRDWRLLGNERWGNPPSQSFCSQYQPGKWCWEGGNQLWFGGRGFSLRLQRWFIRNCSACSHSLLMGFNCSVLKWLQTFKSEQGNHSH